MHTTYKTGLFSVLALVATALLHAQSVPASYDLRAEGLAPPMQNQGNASICWAVASSTAIESNLAKKGIITFQESDLHVSAWHMASNTGIARSVTYSATQRDYERDDGSRGWGGDGFSSNLGYLTRGRGQWSLPDGIPGQTLTTIGGGTVSLSGDERNQIPQNTLASHQPLTDRDLPAVNQPIAYIARGIYQIEADTPSGQVDAVKKAIMDYGAVTTGIDMDGYYMTEQEYGSKTTFYYTATGGQEAQENHEVTIIGWDDHYVTSTGTGAWIIQNSWGKPKDHEGDMNGAGIFYVSYNDAFAGKGVAAFNMDEPGQYADHVLQNHIFTMDEGAGMGEIQAFQAATILDLDEFVLGGIGLLGDKDQVVSVNLYNAMGWGEDGNWDISPEQALYTFDATFNENGYALFDLEQGITLPDGTRLLIIVDYGEQVDLEYIPLGSNENIGDYEGLSYYYDGSDWVDFTENGNAPGVYFLKGLTLKAGLIPEPGACLLILFGTASMIGRRKR